MQNLYLNRVAMAELLIPTLKQTITITVFVLFMMVLIEYLNIQTRNRWAQGLQKSPLLQIIIAGLLGITPGCMGAFSVVSLYTHRMMGLAALVTVMIATSGDESFVMFAMFPGKALLLNGILLAIAILAGWLVHIFIRNKNTGDPKGFKVHNQDYCKSFSRDLIIPQLRSISFERALLLVSALIFITLFSVGLIGEPEWNWERVTFLIGSLFLLFVFGTVPEHFLIEHLYNHVIKKHLLRIFLWTWGAFVILHFVQTNVLFNDLVQHNSYIILLIAVLIGIIPESGPHLVFVTMFSQHLIPFSILLTNSIVQDGHGMLPLLAESRIDFIKVKIINVFAGLVVGSALLWAGF
jgi:hypothetical protein